MFEVRSKVRSPEVSKVKFGLFQHFSTNWRITRELEELQRCAKAQSIALLTFFRLHVLRFDLRSTASRRAKAKKITVFAKNVFYVMTFDSGKARHSCSQHRVSLVATHRMNYNLTLNVILKIWPEVKVMTCSEKIILHISRSVWSSWTHLRCFHRFSWCLSKVIAEELLVTFHDLKWPWVMRKGHW